MPKKQPAPHLLKWLPKQVETLRKQRGFGTQGDLAERLFLKRASVGKLEGGHAVGLTVEAFYRLALVLNVRPIDLLLPASVGADDLVDLSPRTTAGREPVAKADRMIVAAGNLRRWSDGDTSSPLRPGQIEELLELMPDELAMSRRLGLQPEAQAVRKLRMWVVNGIQVAREGTTPGQMVGTEAEVREQVADALEAELDRAAKRIRLLIDDLREQGSHV
jgi:hypothetical protein